MLQPADNSQKAQFSSTPNYAPAKTVTAPVEQATIGRSLVIKGEVTGSESLYIDGKIEGTINLTDNRETISGRSPGRRRPYLSVLIGHVSKRALFLFFRF